jgi:hypothetical protein
MSFVTAPVLQLNVLLRKTPCDRPSCPSKGWELITMRRTLSRQTIHAALTGFATAALITVSSPVAGAAHAMWGAQTSSSAFVPELFDGGGYGPTAEVAVRQAIGDARTSASAYGLFTCELVGEPEVFQQPPGSLRAFRAHVVLRCTA